MTKFIDLTGNKYGRLTVISKASGKSRTSWTCRCDCGNEITVIGSYLTTGDTTSCGCYKAEIDQNNLRTEYEAKRVDGVALQLFKDQTPRKDSSTGYRGVSKYITRKSKEVRYRAWITVKGKKYYKSGFTNPADAYHIGRKELEDTYLPDRPADQ